MAFIQITPSEQNRTYGVFKRGGIILPLIPPYEGGTMILEKGSLRGAKPLFLNSPLPLNEGKGDTGG
jgi:hypothetical protein